MTERDWLVLDVSALVRREFYATKVYDPFTSVFNALTRIHDYVERFKTRHIAFCFDFPPYKRLELLPGYKAKTIRPELEKAYNETTELMRDLHRKRVLREMGFRNVLAVEGYEADDLFATIIMNLDGEDRIIIVSEDQDLYQLLSWRCSIFHPIKKQFVTARWFRQEYGVPPKWWAGAKAIAGDDTDKIPGVKGVGIKSALDFMKGTVKLTNKRRADIQAWTTENAPEFQRNLKLINLPFPGLEPILLEEDYGYDAQLIARFYAALGRPIPASEVRSGIDVPNL